MQTFFLELWLKFQKAIVAVIAFIGIAAIIFFRGQKSGREYAAQKQQEANDAARKRMEAVKPADLGGTVDSLRKGKF